MKVVLDSNIIIADYWLNSTNFKILFENQKKGNIELLLPEIVLDEVLNKYFQRLLKSKSVVDSELNKFESLTNEKISSSLTDELVNSSVEKYKTHLQNVILHNKIKVLSYPKTDHKFLANKAILKLKPFNTAEKGYRDCLIWENIKTLLTEEEMVVVLPELVFISNNYKDFATSEFELHPDLVGELEKEDFNSESVKIYSNLTEFNERQGKLFFSQAESLKDKLLEDKDFQTNIIDSLNTFLYDNFVGSELYSYGSDDEEDFSEPTVSSIYEDYDITINDVKKFTANEYILDVEFEVESEIDFFIEKSEYWSMREDKKGISIQDSDWNKHVMWASSTEPIHLSMTIIIDAQMNLTSCQINKAIRNFS